MAPSLRRVLVVCLGNTCRSPMAEGFLRELLGPGTSVESAGAETEEGLAPTKDAVLVMRELGLDISGHRSREVPQLDLRNFDLIIAMTSQIGCILRSLGVEECRLRELNVPDPYGKGIEAYRNAAQNIRSQLCCLLRQEDYGDHE